MSNGQPSLMEQLEAMKQAGQSAPVTPPQLPQQMTSHPGNGGMVVGGGGPPGAFPTPINPNHAHPGLVLPPSAGYAPRQPCNGHGHYASSNGQGFIAVEPGHMCQACVGPATINPSQVLPPDSPVRTSTPAEIAAVVEGKKKKVKKTATSDAATIEDFVKLQGLGFTTQEITDVQKQGYLADALSGKLTPGMLRQPRPPVGYQGHVSPALPAPVVVVQLPQSAPPSASMILPGEVAHHDPGDGTHAIAAPQALAAAQASWYATSGPQQPQPQQPVASAPTQAPTLLSASLTPDQVCQQYPQTAQQPAQSSLGPLGSLVAAAQVQLSGRPPAGLVLLVDCVPAKGVPAALLADWLGPVLDYACSQVLDDNGRSAPVADLRLVPYARGKGYLAAAVRLALGTVPPVLSIDTSQYGADVVIEALTPWAPTIIVSGPGRR